MTKLEQIKQEAQIIREWAEQLQAKHKLWHDSLAEMCGICSYALFKQLLQKGFSVCLASNDEHVFVTWRGYIVDITATQFGKKEKVYISRLNHKWPDDYWNIEQTAKTLREAKRIFTPSWPTYQSPYRWRLRS